MSNSTLYPPHPAEGRAADHFASYRSGHGWQAENVPTSPSGEPGTEVRQAAPALSDRRIHWLAYDPSSRSQYPVD